MVLPSCNLLCESTRETSIITSAPILIIHLCWFSNQGGQLVKNENFFSCTQGESNKDLTVPITGGRSFFYRHVFFDFQYLTIQALWIGVITGILSRTYTPLLGTLAMTNWFLMLKKIMSTRLHHTSFFTTKFKFFPRIFQIFSWFCKGVLSFQTRSLGVMTPYVTPVLYRNWVCSLSFQALQPCSP